MIESGVNKGKGDGVHPGKTEPSTGAGQDRALPPFDEEHHQTGQLLFAGGAKGKIGRVSGYGWSAGYLGGLLTLLIGLMFFVRPEYPAFGLSKELGEDIGFKQAGVFYLANTEEQVAGYEDWLKHAKEYQIDSHILFQYI